jgi:hypothetical protein
MSDNQFNLLLQTANGQYAPGTRYATIRNAINTNGNYFTTLQIRQLLSITSVESERLALAKLAYLKVVDQATFYSLIDLFNTPSNKTELNAYIIQNGGIGTTETYSSRVPMVDATFQDLLRAANDHILPWSKTADVRTAFNSDNYFSTAQIRQLLNIIYSETDKLNLAKLAWGRVSDPTNFTQLYDLFTSPTNKDNLEAYIKARPF